ncbi:hypothetical protein LL946_17035 [Knoellia locipacati]|uniref:putative immunity protein n=1 Tax=Knoellia locipacati TaxID=882824 RepID=UPI00384A570D
MILPEVRDPRFLTTRRGGTVSDADHRLLALWVAGQAACVAHVAAHELGAAAYAIKAVRETAPDHAGTELGRRERDWQRQQLPSAIRELVLDDQRLRNDNCWSVFT